MRRLCALGLGILWCWAAVSAPLPRNAPAAHLGVQICANSTCHGAGEASPFAAVSQNEFRIWHEQDAHSKAFQALKSERGAMIAERLGIANASSSGQCLVCHSDYVTGERKGKRHKYSDGVGCEACHGGAAKWLGFHASGINSHAENVEIGMYPTDDPEARAELCFSCHQGTTDHPMTHRLLGAGHPPLVIELDAYTLARPAHHVEDDDYVRRKGVVAPLKVWAIGQIKAAQQWMTLHGGGQAQPAGGWPEFAQYECYGCHRSTRGADGAGVGVPMLNTGQLMMAAVVMELLDPAAAKQLRAAAAALRSGTNGAAQRVRTALSAALQTARDAALPASRAPELVRRLLERAGSGDFETYSAGLQATYAAAIALDLQGLGDAPELGALYDQVNDGSRYRSADWVEKLRRLPGAADGT